MTLKENAEALSALHVKGDPLVLYNIWDAGSARAVQAAGARAVATGSWSVAGAQGFDDGQTLPIEMLILLVTQITRVSDVPVTVDFEGAYATDPQGCADNVVRLMQTGAAGINFEDQVVGGTGLHSIDEQVARIAAIRLAADGQGVPLVLNARTDLFLKEPDPAKHAGLMGDALTRASAYQGAGASCFFAPGLTDDRLIAALCETAGLPVNVMKGPKTSDIATLASLGVSRVSFGPGPFRSAMKTLEADAKAALGMS
ncbi:isocitrate lyase/phosphoenolpyruvate mutase family protein [Actibacterium sp. 188UL27-1]|uniref:isocitrate lyase/PEP mutase family protein n=1 Tax=Actibacterium sp. 188UL27-1 TaxID=2786961 RepID=UPI00195A4D33|nr:isocitrate lyase/phosphoenolpyruvate mutase family protein [Actibacterium sp. 188UL27-1]MBM7069199.1 isocitrate lyase/phosphoenolpyruvate mutase family protein [Actibacterium sp. 188UL27-1]